MKVATLDVDAQKCFTPICPQELPVPEGHLIVDELNRQATYADLRIGAKDAHSPQAVWVADAHNPQFSSIEGPNVDIRWNLHAVPGTTGFELLDGLPHPNDYDYFIWKGIEPDMHPYGCCYHDLANTLSTGLIEYLRCQAVDVILIGGLTLDYCVKTTVLQLRAAGFPIFVNLAATRAVNSATGKQSIDEMRAQGAEFITHADVIPAALEHWQQNRTNN